MNKLIGIGKLGEIVVNLEIGVGADRGKGVEVDHEIEDEEGVDLGIGVEVDQRRGEEVDLLKTGVIVKGLVIGIDVGQQIGVGDPDLGEEMVIDMWKEMMKREQEEIVQI